MKIPNKPILVLIGGKAGCGKTTASIMVESLIRDNHLFEELAPVRTYHFAQGVKRLAADFGWDGKKDDKGRKLLQNVGGTGRAYNENIWANWTILDIDTDINGMHTVLALIDDWRFPNESAVASKTDWNVFTAYIYAPNREVLKGKPEYNDVSETSLSSNPDEYDFFIDNTGSFDSLKVQLISMLNEVSKRIDYFGGE